MPCSGSFPERQRNPRSQGFTLLELTLALACSGLLVGALVTIWVQVIRTTTASSVESVAQGQKRDLHRQLQRLVSTLQWTPSSHLPQGVLAWGASETGFMVWSKESFGASPGPVRWTFQIQDGVWMGQWEDPTPGAEGGRQGLWPLAGVAELRLELLKGELSTQAEQVQWVDFKAWDPSQIFRPLGFRFRVKWKDDLQETLVMGLP